MTVVILQFMCTAVILLFMCTAVILQFLCTSVILQFMCTAVIFTFSVYGSYFPIYVYGSSFNNFLCMAVHVISLLCFLFLCTLCTVLAPQPVLGMSLNKKQRSEIVAEKDELLYTQKL